MSRVSIDSSLNAVVEFENVTMRIRAAADARELDGVSDCVAWREKCGGRNSRS